MWRGKTRLILEVGLLMALLFILVDCYSDHPGDPDRIQPIEDKSAVSEEDLAQTLRMLPDWKYDGSRLSFEWSWTDWDKLTRLLKDVAYIVETQGHHPDLTLRVQDRYFRIDLVTASEGGLTRADINFAQSLSDRGVYK